MVEVTGRESMVQTSGNPIQIVANRRGRSAQTALWLVVKADEDEFGVETTAILLQKIGLEAGGAGSVCTKLFVGWPSWKCQRNALRVWLNLLCVCGTIVIASSDSLVNCFVWWCGQNAGLLRSGDAP
jgi:hypothetical protein